MNDKELIKALRKRAVTDSPVHALMNEAADRLADALAARQPTEDGEYIFRLIESVKGSRSSVEINGVKIMPCDEFGRTAAVPDAATELARADSEWRDGTIIAQLAKAEAERDAALAAIERVRAICHRLGQVDGDVSQPAPSYYVSVGRNVVATEVLAALDGAPEPGLPGKHNYRWKHPNGRVGWTFRTREEAEVAKPAERDLVLERSANDGETWLPVEGESKS